jgi:hypothetical protein
MEKIKIFKLQVEKKSIGNNIPELKGMQVFGSSERVIDGIEYSFIEYIPNWISTLGDINIKRSGDYIEIPTTKNEKDCIRETLYKYYDFYTDMKTPSVEMVEELIDGLYNKLESFKHKGILSEPVKHSVPELLNELKYGRKAIDQLFINKCIDSYNYNTNLIESYITKGDTIIANDSDSNGKVSVFNVDKICIIPDKDYNYFIFTVLTYDGTTNSIAGNLNRFKNIKVINKLMTAKSENGDTLYFDKQGNLIN